MKPPNDLRNVRNYILMAQSEPTPLAKARGFRTVAALLFLTDILADQFLLYAPHTLREVAVHPQTVPPQVFLQLGELAA
jgi:hypothetical protein